MGFEFCGFGFYRLWVAGGWSWGGDVGHGGIGLRWWCGLWDVRVWVLVGMGCGRHELGFGGSCGGGFWYVWWWIALVG